MGNLAPLDFGSVIAFFLPGMVGVYGLRYLSAQVAELWALVLSGQSPVGAGAVLLLFSLAAGLVCSAIRALLIDPVVCADLKRASSDDLGALAVPDVLNAYRAAVDANYRFAQFDGNMALALIFLAVVRWGTAPIGTSVGIGWIGLCALVGSVLAIAYCLSLRKTMKRVASILGAGATKTATRALAAQPSVGAAFWGLSSEAMGELLDVIKRHGVSH